jgi:L-threonylcarbamoyladenylate synthase
MPNIIECSKIAASLIAQGNLVAFPTETVYGLGAAADNQEACAKIYALKGRPSFNPLIVHVSSILQAKSLGYFTDDALLLAEKFWPGPLTLVVKRRFDNNIAPNVTAGLDTIAIRMPLHPCALDLLRLSGKAIAAPSANLSNYITATSYQHVYDDFLQTDLNILVSSEYHSCAIESTIIDTTAKPLRILRHGFILPQDISKFTQIEHSNIYSRAIKAPGMLDKHYCPKTAVRLKANSILDTEVGIDFGSQLTGAKFNLSAKSDLHQAAKQLYDILRQADAYSIKYKLRQIAIASIPNEGIGVAINDRLQRSSGKTS